jgi:hypothetical protein
MSNDMYHLIQVHLNQNGTSEIISKQVGFGVDGHPSDLMSSSIGKILNFFREFMATLSTLC